MKQFLTVLRFELNNYLKNKSFTVTTLILALLMAGVIVVPTLIPGLLGGGGGSGDSNPGKLSALGFYAEAGAVSDEERLLSGMPAEWVTFESAEELHEAVENETVEAGFILGGPTDVTYVVNNMEISESFSEAFSGALAAYQKEAYLLEKGLTDAEIQEVQQLQINMDSEILGKNSAGNYMYTYILVFVTYFLILFYGQMIATSITTEKSNRAIEILVTSVNSNSLIFGKVLAGAISGVVQTVVILGSGFLAYHFRRDAWGGLLDFLSQIPAKVLVSYVIFGILSYLLYAFIYGILGALVSKTEDISKSATTVTLIYLASFFAALMGMSNTEGMLLKVASFVPFTSGNAMFVRIAMGSVATWEILVSGFLLVASCAAAGMLAAKLFRFGTLQYANPIKFTTALRAIRKQ